MTLEEAKAIVAAAEAKRGKKRNYVAAKVCRCEACGLNVDSSQVVERAMYWTEAEAMQRYVKVCRACSKAYSDAELTRYSHSITEYSATWCTGSHTKRVER